MPLIVFFTLLFYEGNHDPNLCPPSLTTAIARADNDYAFEEPYKTYGDIDVNLPISVRNKICEVTLREFFNNNYETIEPKKCSELFGPVFRIDVPHREYLHLYIYKLYTVMHYYDFVLMLHDSRNDNITLSPARFSGKSMYGYWPTIPLQRPYVKFEDINLDGNYEIVFKERIHNGTELNAIVHHFLHIDNDLSLVPIFRLEACSHYSYLDGRQPGYLYRTIEKLNPNQIQINVSASTGQQENKNKKIGYVVLGSKNSSSPFTVKQQIMQFNEKSTGYGYENYEKLLLQTWLSPYR